jgi:hypothetical protein
MMTRLPPIPKPRWLRPLTALCLGRKTRCRLTAMKLAFHAMMFHAMAVAFAGEPAAAPPATKSETFFVRFKTVDIFCGPSKDFYTTGSLQRGAAVVVYHRTADGWCAIQPPEGSHDWLAAEQAYLLPGGKKAEVVDAKTPAWIGSSQIGDKQRFRWQVALQPGQQVEVIGELEQAIDSDKLRMWYKILPPPGEYRWIRSEALTSTPPALREPLEPAADALAKAVDPMIQPAVAHQAGTSTIVLERAESLPEATPEIPMETVEADPAIIVGSIESGPRVGEYIEGEGIVVESMPESWSGEAGELPLGALDGEILGEETLGMVAEGTLCPNCQQAGCTTCDDSHQLDFLHHWNHLEPSSGPVVHYRPLARILGLIGLSVVEGEPIEATSCTGHPDCGCQHCARAPMALSPRISDRFSHLPRPGRRSSRSFPRDDWMSNDLPSHRGSSLLESAGSSALASEMDTPTNRRAWNELGSATAPKSQADWHGLAADQSPARMDGAGSIHPAWEQRSGEEMPPAAVRGVSANVQPLRFSTPELQRAMADLTRMVAEPMPVWELRGLAGEAQRWIDQSSDPIARGEARLLLERIEEFEAVRRRSQGSPENAVAFTPTSPIESISVPAQSVGYQKPLLPSATPSLLGNDHYGTSDQGVQRNPDGTLASDASGWLVEVFSAQPGQPAFALTDDYGGLIAYVQPSPGMNLRRYLKQPVGIYGIKGYLPQLSARQIVAERIIRLR